MSKKPTVSTPLILLQQLSRSLLRHFEEACDQALNETQRVQAKLGKQRHRLENHLRCAALELEVAAVAGKPKALARVRKRIEVLQGSLDELLDRQLQTHTYLLQLQRDVQTGLALSKGIGKVADAAGQALDIAAGSPLQGRAQPASAASGRGLESVTGASAQLRRRRPTAKQSASVAPPDSTTIKP